MLMVTDADNVGRRMSAMPNRATAKFNQWVATCATAAFARVRSRKRDEDRESEVPALRIRDEEIAKHLNARYRFQLFRIDEVGVERATALGAHSITDRPVFVTFFTTCGAEGSHGVAILHGRKRQAVTPGTLLQLRGGEQVPAPIPEALAPMTFM